MSYLDEEPLGKGTAFAIGLFSVMVIMLVLYKLVS